MDEQKPLMNIEEVSNIGVLEPTIFEDLPSFSSDEVNDDDHDINDQPEPDLHTLDDDDTEDDHDDHLIEEDQTESDSNGIRWDERVLESDDDWDLSLKSGDDDDDNDDDLISSMVSTTDSVVEDESESKDFVTSKKEKQQERGRPRGEIRDRVVTWGQRSNLVDRNGEFQRCARRLTHFVAIYKCDYVFYFDLVNGHYPKFVRKLVNGMEIWRMCFNIYSTGFQNLIAHLGEIHAFYRMEFVDGQLQWSYKDFNFYPSTMRYGFRVSSVTIASVYSSFIKFVCLKNNLLKTFPNVKINSKYFLKKRFEENVQAMKNRLNEVEIISGDAGDQLPSPLVGSTCDPKPPSQTNGGEQQAVGKNKKKSRRQVKKKETGNGIPGAVDSVPGKPETAVPLAEGSGTDTPGASVKTGPSGSANMARKKQWFPQRRRFGGTGQRRPFNSGVKANQLSN